MKIGTKVRNRKGMEEHWKKGEESIEIRMREMRKKNREYGRRVKVR